MNKLEICMFNLLDDLCLSSNLLFNDDLELIFVQLPTIIEKQMKKLYDFSGGASLFYKVYPLWKKERLCRTHILIERMLLNRLSSENECITTMRNTNMKGA